MTDTQVPVDQVRELAMHLAKSIAGLGYPVGLGVAPPEDVCMKAAQSIFYLYPLAAAPSFSAQDCGCGLGDKCPDPPAAAPSVQPDREVIEAKWAGDSTVLGTGWRVEVLASDPLPGEIIDGHQLPRLPGRTACWIRFWPDGRDAPMYRSCDLFDLELSDEAFDALSALPPVAQKEEG